MDWQQNYNFQVKRGKQSVEHLTTLPHKFYSLEDIVLRWIFGVLESFVILWHLEDLPLNQKMLNKHIKKLKVVALYSLNKLIFQQTSNKSL